ncbi:hypothetical protein [Streptomyces sp. NBC_00038]|uniref:hypothetical protein n=1 Tax=Streptomyces sp. NBC_00038 TaxID=2903615 RepID=UPI002254A7B2|nr:hypothetical protein [Streptomyces sp. NBC_00038]MCX5559171.1 hypothetical protein [Streptomyces sp. NBC_00038]
MPGTVLLLAASPVGKGRLVDAASVLPVLAAVSPAVLSGADTANVVELADPLEPQAVLTRLRAAAAAPGPLTVFVTGQLQLDRRQRLPHLALARTTPATVRYTAFPWHWIAEELRLRPPGTSTLVVDLHADPEAWQHLTARPLTAGPTTALYGRVAPPPPRRTVASPAYMKAVATLLRSGYRPPLPQLHQQALGRIVGEGAYGDMVLEPGVGAGVGFFAPSAPTQPVPGGSAPRPPYRPERPRPQTPDGLEVVDPHALIAAAVQSEQHGEADSLAARQEQEALRMYGPASEQVLHWMEVRADLAMFAGDPVRSCRTWLAVANARLGAGQAPDAVAVETAADRAHHQWGSIRDAARARELGPALAELRGRVPGRREGALSHVQKHLNELQATEQLAG